jgi:hypothetical protein
MTFQLELDLQEDCGAILRRRQIVEKEKFGDINYNFILAGDDLLIEGRSFEINFSSMTGLRILFLGNFTETPPPKSLMKRFEELFQYAIELEKLDSNFLLYGERQLDTKTPTTPGRALHELLQQEPFDKHFNFNVTEPEKCRFGCGYP